MQYQPEPNPYASLSVLPPPPPTLTEEIICTLAFTITDEFFKQHKAFMTNNWEPDLTHVVYRVVVPPFYVSYVTQTTYKTFLKKGLKCTFDQTKDFNFFVENLHGVYIRVITIGSNQFRNLLQELSGKKTIPSSPISILDSEHVQVSQPIQPINTSKKSTASDSTYRAPSVSTTVDPDPSPPLAQTSKGHTEDEASVESIVSFESANQITLREKEKDEKKAKGKKNKEMEAFVKECCFTPNDLNKAKLGMSNISLIYITYYYWIMDRQRSRHLTLPAYTDQDTFKTDFEHALSKLSDDFPYFKTWEKLANDQRLRGVYTGVEIRFEGTVKVVYPPDKYTTKVGDYLNGAIPEMMAPTNKKRKHFR